MQVLDLCEKCTFLCQCLSEEDAGDETSCKQNFGFSSYATLFVVQSRCFADARSTSSNTFRQTNLLSGRLSKFKKLVNSEQATSSMVKRQYILTKKITPVKLGERLQGDSTSTRFREDNERHWYHPGVSILPFDLRCFQFNQNFS